MSDLSRVPLSERLRSAASAASLQGARWKRWELVHLAVDAAAQLEDRGQRTKELDELVDELRAARSGQTYSVPAANDVFKNG